MQLVKLTIVFLALMTLLCSANIIMNTDKPRGFAELEEAAINILTNCYENQDKTIVVFGSFPNSFTHKLTSRGPFSLVLMDDRKRPMNNTEYWTGYHRNTQHKVYIIVILIPVNLRYLDILNTWMKCRYYNHMASVLLIGWSPQKRYAGCDRSRDTFNLLIDIHYSWIQNANLLCVHPRMGTVMYGSNGFGGQAPKPWRLVRTVEFIGGRPDFSYFVRKYHKNKDICKNLDYDKTRDVGGFTIEMARPCRPPYCSREARLNRTRKRFSLIEDNKHNYFIDDFIVRVNATGVDVYEEVVLGEGSYDHTVLQVTPSMLHLVAESFFTYPHELKCLCLVTQYRGNKSQLQKILSVIDSYSWIGLGIVCLINLTFFKYFFRQPLMDAILNIVRLCSNFGISIVPQNVASRIYIACLLFFVVTMQGIFVSNLAALLTQDSPVRQVESLQDLADLDYVAYTSPTFFSLFNDVLPKEQIHILVQNDYCLTYVQMFPWAVCLSPRTVAEDTVAEYNLHTSECIRMEYITHIIPHYWPLEDRLNEFLGRVVSGGILMPLYYIVDEKRLLEAEAMHLDPEPRKITLNDLVFAFVILGAGLACALITFVVEIMIHWYHHRVRRTRVRFLN